MATTYIPIDRAKALGAAFYDGLRNLQNGIQQLIELQAIAETQIDGSDFSVMETQFGFQAGQGDDAKAELDSLLAKLTTDSSVDHVLAARNQAAAKFGVV